MEEKKKMKEGKKMLFLLVGFVIGICLLSDASTFPEPIDVNITAPLDEISNAVITIELEHHEIHEGNHYFICNFTTLNNGDDADFIVSTNDKILHMQFVISGTSQTEISIFEGITFNLYSGNNVTVFNNNRNSTKTTNASFESNSAIINTGRNIFAQSSGLAGVTPSRADVIGLISRENELMLNTNEDYLFRITSRDNNNIISYCGEWYED